MTLMGFESQTFRPTVRRANHCATGAGSVMVIVRVSLRVRVRVDVKVTLWLGSGVDF